MQQGLKTKLNPIKIIGVWTISMVVLTPIFMYISNIGASGGEQKPLTTLAAMIDVTVYTLLEGTTWYVNKIEPGFYWTIWSDYIVHKIHQRVLEHIKTQAEL